jgi:hypothetical protein
MRDTIKAADAILVVTPECVFRASLHRSFS